MSNRTINVGSKDLDACSLGRIEKRFNRLVSEDPCKHITFLFGTCPGGDVEAVLGFVDKVLASGVPVRTRNVGRIYSAAVLLFLVGETREGTRDCEFTLHPFRVNPEEVRFDDLEGDFASWLGNVRKLRDRVIEFIISRTKLSSEEVIRFFSSNEFHFDKGSAKRFGILRDPDPVESKV